MDTSSNAKVVAAIIARSCASALLDGEDPRCIAIVLRETAQFLEMIHPQTPPENDSGIQHVGP
jgi:hypothetical protein